MFDPISLSHLTHLKANVPGAGTIVDVREKVAMNVDHLSDYSPTRQTKKKTFAEAKVLG